MCLPWHFLLLPSAELLPSAQIAAGADLVQPVTCCLWEENLTGAAARGSGALPSPGAPQVEREEVEEAFSTQCLQNWGCFADSLTVPAGSRFGPLLAIC